MKNKQIEKIQIKLLQTIDNPLNDNVDVVISIADKIFSATFFTLQNVSELMAKWEKTGECQTSAYFWAVDSVIVHKLDVISIESVIAELLENGEFYKVFHDITNGVQSI
ncbi:hypothetical protein FACS1894170_04860 [Planctomycetales bacterium]|nr:hypothetical protein FACS1894170_04860 [Planctomycetales bacterium]